MIDRMLPQYVSLGLSILIVLISLMGLYFKRSKMYSSVMWLIFGLTGVVFYVWVLFTPAPHVVGPYTNSDVSAIRTLIQYSLVASWLWLWTFWNIKKNE